MVKRWLLIGIAALLLVAVGYAVYTLSPFFPKKEAAPGETAPQIILGSVIDAVSYALSEGKLSEKPEASEGSVVSRSRRASIGSTLSLIMPPNTLGTVLVFETPEGFRESGSPSSMKDAAVLSFDGALVAYAELDAPPGSLLYSENVSDWRVHVFNAATGEDTDLGVGYAPYFISQNPDVLVFSSPGGIVSFELGSDEAPALFSQSAIESTLHAAHASPDGRSMAVYNALTSQWDIYSVAQTHPLKLSALSGVQSAFDKVALSDTHFFGVYRDEATNAMTLWRYPLDGIAPFMRLEDGELLYSFAEGEIPYQIIP